MANYTIKNIRHLPNMLPMDYNPLSVSLAYWDNCPNNVCDVQCKITTSQQLTNVILTATVTASNYNNATKITCTKCGTADICTITQVSGVSVSVYYPTVESVSYSYLSVLQTETISINVTCSEGYEYNLNNVGVLGQSFQNYP